MLCADVERFVNMTDFLTSVNLLGRVVAMAAYYYIRSSPSVVGLSVDHVFVSSNRASRLIYRYTGKEQQGNKYVRLRRRPYITIPNMSNIRVDREHARPADAMVYQGRAKIAVLLL